MDTHKRTFAKAVTWQMLGFVVMIGLGYVATGTLAGAGGLALASTLLSTFTYMLHERIWQRVRWGLRDRNVQ